MAEQKLTKADKRYQELMHDAEQALKDIKSGLRDYDAGVDEAHWGHIGDLARVVELLDTAAASLGDEDAQKRVDW